MAVVDAYTALDMWTGFNFSNLWNNMGYNGTPTRFSVDNWDGTSETFEGYGFSYDWWYGNPTGTGVVTGYHADDYYGSALLDISGIYVPASQILNASKTASIVDDALIVVTALAGSDDIYGSNYNDRLDGFGGDDFVFSFGGNDVVYGGSGNDYLDGGTGADRMTGGAGNDTFIANAGDSVVEAAGQGSDAVRASSTFALAAGQHVESLATTSSGGTGAINLYGNEIAQAIAGNNGANLLSGGGGNDVLTGMSGNDYLDGGTGADRMTGGAGNDTFIANAGDSVVEAAGQGRDAVRASAGFALAAGQHVESLATTASSGTGAINLFGNEIAQAIVGNNGTNVLSGGGGNDVISGLAGNDVLYGGAGNDAMTGGAGNDSFVFNTAISSVSNVDRITDFNVVQDTIRLDNAVMPGLGSQLGSLSSTAFWKSTSGLAHDSNDRVVYETDTGRLSYDSNGSAAGGVVHIATLNTNLALSEDDFLVF